MASTSSPVQAPPRAFHFMGICGTAMGAVAAMLRDQGYTVTGSDEQRLSADVDLPRGKRHRDPGRVQAGEPARRGRDPRRRQHDQARQPGAGGRAGRQALLPLAAGDAEDLLPAQDAQPRRHRHARQDDHDLAAGLDLRARGPQALVPHRRPAEESAAGLHAAGGPLLDHRGRRVRHRLLRQAQQVPPLPARAGHHQQSRVRPRRYFRQPRRDPEIVLAPRAHRAAQRHGAGQRRRRRTRSPW